MGLVDSAGAGGPGLDGPRLPNTELKFPGPPPTAPGNYILERLFPRIEIKNITDIVMPPGDDTRVFVVNQKGVVWIVQNEDDPETATVALDMSHRVCHFLEQGMYNLAFDLDWERTGRVYIHYSPNTVCGDFVPSPPQRISRFWFQPGSYDLIDEASEEILIEQDDHGTFHYGGGLAFGPDGYLYISMGDGSLRPWESQNPGTLFGAFLRIDVSGSPDRDLPYAIPGDNPWVGREGWRPELYAKGLRNPFSFSFDPPTGLLISCDVGQASYEEINIIRSGANYGWPDREGPFCSPGATPEYCELPHLVDPEVYYAHQGGQTAVVGGGVYRGSRLPELQGTYIYGSIFTGEVWASPLDGDRLTTPTLISTNPNLTLTAIGLMNDGELWFADYADSADNGFYKTTGGGIYRLARPELPSAFPLRLSDNPALLAAGGGRGHDVEGVMEYTPNSQLWSDGAHKERYVAMPDLATAEFRERDGFGFPEGTVLVKNFSLPLDDRAVTPTLKRIETRIMLRHEGTWHGFTYEWLDDESDAVLLTGGKRRAFTRIDAAGKPYFYEWVYPSRSECIQCHTPASGQVLGLSADFLNSEIVYTKTNRKANQLETWESLGFFTQGLPDPPEKLPSIPNYANDKLLPEVRAKAYLEANCAMCHRPGGGVQSPVDLRWETPLEAMHVLNAIPQRGSLGIDDARIVAPRSLDRSILYQRLTSLSAIHRMPPIGVSITDPTGEEIMRNWINGLPTPPASGWVTMGE